MTHPVEGSPDAPRSGAPAVPDPEGCWGSLALANQEGMGRFLGPNKLDGGMNS